MRKINASLIDRLLNGKLNKLLEYVKSDDELRLEIRNDDAFVYYRKGKALEIKNLKVDKNYGDVPSPKDAADRPEVYFEAIKKVIDKWLKDKKNRAEFDTQQKIAQCNQNIDDRFIIIDMEYGFEQNEIEIVDREKRGTFDLLGIERKTGKIVFFEVKKGMGAVRGQSGVQGHIEDFHTYLFGKNSARYRKNLVDDIKNIIDAKKQLGLIKNFEIPENLGKTNPELIFVFHPDNDDQIDRFKKEVNNRFEVIIVDDDNYKLT